MPAYDAALAKFAEFDAQVLGIGVDSVYSNIAWQKKETGILHFPLCSDFYPHGAVVEKYGIMRHGPPLSGISERAVIVVDKQGRVAFAKIYPLDLVPDNEEVFEVLRGLMPMQARKAV